MFTTKYTKNAKKKVKKYAEGGVVDDERDKYGELRPFPGSVPTFPPGSSKPRYVMPDGSIRPVTRRGGPN
jgi:hypothetical protein